MSPDSSPVGVGIVGLEGECEVGPIFGLGGGDSCAHEAGGRVDEEADRGGAVCFIWNGDAVEGANRAGQELGRAREREGM